MVQAVKTSGQLGILRCNLDLAQFVVEGTFTGRQLGSGYFGSVEEVGIKAKPAVLPLIPFGHVYPGSGLKCGQ